jgi:putative flippase GtrA
MRFSVGCPLVRNIMSKRCGFSSLLGLIGLLSRFGVVGLLATLTYLVMANALIYLGALGPGLASVIAYLAGMVVSYLGQSRWTFNGAGGKREVARFAVLSSAGLLLSYAAPHAALRLGLPSAAGTAIPALAVPLLSFLVMRLWVFGSHRPRDEPRGDLIISGTVDDKIDRPPI